MNPVVECLPNGLRVVMAEAHAAPVVSFQMWVGVGSADERKGEEGLAHVFEHMLFKGTARRKVGEIARDVERAGGQINAWTSYDETVFYITLASRYWKKGLDILADAIQYATIDEEELERELAVILEEIRMGEDIPERVVTQKLFNTMFKKHPYGRPVIGYDRTVRQFTRKKVVNFFERWYRPRNMVLVVAGDFNNQTVLKQVSDAFSSFKGKRTPARVTRVKEPQQLKARVTHKVKPISEAHLAIGFPIPELQHEDVPAIDLLAAIIGQGASSRLETVVRRRLSLVTGIRSMAYTPRDPGLFGVFASTPTRDLKPALHAILNEIFRVTKEPVSLAELEKARTLLESDKIYTEETVDGIARKAGFYTLFADNMNFEERYLVALSSKSPEDLMEVANRYFTSPRAGISVVVPDPTRHTARRRLSWIKGRGKNRKVDSKKLDSMLRGQVEASQKSTKRIVKAKAPRNKTVVLELSTGDVLLVRQDPSSRLVAARAAFLGGLRGETPSQGGLTALLASTITRGTHSLSAEQVAGTIDNLACSISGFAGRNTLGVQGEFLSSNFEKGFALMAECLRSPAYLKQEVEREKELMIEEIRASKDIPSQKLFRMFQKALFGKHPYGRPLYGTEKSVGKHSPRTLRNHLEKITGPGSMILAVVGGKEVDEVRELAERYMITNHAPSPAFKQPAPWRLPGSPKQVLGTLPKQQSHVMVGFPGTTITSEDRFVIEVLVEILGGHGGRLFSGVREKRGLAYAVSAMSLEGIEPGYIAFYAATSPGQELQVVRAMFDELEQILKSGPSTDELRRVKRHLIGTRAIAWQRASTRAGSMALDHIYGNGHDASESYPKHIDAIQKETVKKAANHYLNANRPVFACVGPDVEGLTFIDNV